MKQQTKQTITTILAITTPDATTQEHNMSGVSLREQKLEAKVKYLTERLHDVKRMTINSHIQKHMYQLEECEEYQKIWKRIHNTIRNEEYTTSDTLITLLSCQTKLVESMVAAAYLGALQDQKDELVDGSCFLEECAEDLNPTDGFSLDVSYPFNVDTLTDIFDGTTIF